MKEWTEAQREAIAARNPEVLVSAAAGSGKTAVLLERVMAMLREGIPLDRMLIMTFTHAAANEMRERLTLMLEAQAEHDPRMMKQFQMIGRADISTLHSFCKKLVTRHFQAANTDPLSGMIDENQSKEAFAQALDEEMNALYEAPDPDAQALIERFDEARIMAMVKSLYQFLMAQDDPWGWVELQLNEQHSGGLNSHPGMRVMENEALLLLSGSMELLRSCQSMCKREDGPRRYLASVCVDMEMVAMFIQRIGEGHPEAIPGLSFARLSSARADPMEDPTVRDDAKALRDKAKELAKTARSLLPDSAETAQEWAKENAKNLPQIRALTRLCRLAHDRFQAYKEARALWDYSDLEHLALKLLQDAQVAREVSGSFDALFVDEYQDISHIQEAIIRKLHSEHNTLFMVGDVKQSIYRFRLADPTLFLNKYKRFDRAPSAPARLILLKENFRSRPCILQAVNLVFSHAMRQKATEIDYDEKAQLTTLSQPDADPPLELWLIQKGQEEAPELPDEALELDDPEEDDSGDFEEEEPSEGTSSKDRKGEMERAFVYEARLIARRIRELQGTFIKDSDGEKRPLQLRDIAILLRASTRRASVMAEILSQTGIPTYSDADGEFYTQPEIRDILALIEILDNPLQDGPLIGALSCPAFGFSPGELADIRLHDKNKETPLHQSFFELARTKEQYQAAREKLDQWRFMANHMPLEQFMRILLRQSGIYAATGAREDGAIRRANLRMLASRAAPSPEPQTLSGFIRHIRNALKQGGSPASATLGMQENVVRIMTLHKSKGLEFPVVFLPDLAASFKRKQRLLPLVMDTQAGLALLSIDPQMRIIHEGFAYRAVRVKKSREELSEEARLLYVGMTRARERLIMIGAPDNLDSALARWGQPQSDYTAGSALSMLDWVGASLFPALKSKQDLMIDDPGGSQWQIAYEHTANLQGSMEKARPEMPDAETDTISDAVRGLMETELPRSLLPLKSSVSALVSGRVLTGEDIEETPDIKRRELVYAPPLSPLPQLNEGKGLTGLQRGAAAHKALSAMNAENYAGLSDVDLSAAITTALNDLAARGILREEERQDADEEAIKRFFQSDLAARMAKSPERYAEWPFTLRIERGMILQGVLDACFLEDGTWVLVDYKTDRGAPEELAQKYRSQMRWYMRALRDITRLPVKEAWLYFLRSGTALRVSEEEPITLDMYTRQTN